MTFQQIFFVTTLAIEENFSRAAEACFISQSSFSKNIQNVEDELGVKLFIREKHGAYLTPEGKTFVEYSENILKEYQEMRSRISHQINGDKVYTVGLLNICNINNVLPLLTDYELSTNNVRLEIQELDWQSLNAKMKDGQFDVVFSWEETLPSNLFQYPLMDDWVVLMVSKAHPLAAYAGGPPISIASISDETFILASPSAAMKIYDKLFYTAGFKPRSIHTAGHPCSMLHMVKRGIGVGIIAHSTYEHIKSFDDNNDICKLDIKEDYRFRYMACFMDPDNEESQRMMRFFDERLINTKDFPLKSMRI